MVRKIAVIVFLLFGGMLTWLYLLPEDAAQVQQTNLSQEKVSKAAESQINHTPKTGVLVPSDREKAVVITSEKNTGLAYTEREKTELAILQELEERIYSDDPIVEMESLMFQHFHCLPDFDSLMFYAQQATDAALAQIKKAQIVCPEFKKQYPMISDVDQYKSYKDALVPSSDYGRLKKQRDTSLPQSERMTEEVLTAVATQSGPIIAGSGMSVRYGIRYEVASPWQHVLNSSDQFYNAYIMSLATQKLSCEYQNGISCGANSFFMLQQCVQDESFCGVDFLTWYQQVTMPGQQKDVALVIDYLKKAANE